MILCKDCIHKLVSANILPEYFYLCRTCFARPIDVHLKHCHDGDIEPDCENCDPMDI